MMKKQVIPFCVLVLLFAMFEIKAQIPLVKDKSPVARIVAANNPVDLRAAGLLQDFVQRITSARLPIVLDVDSRVGDVVIGNGDNNGLLEDGFRLATENGRLFISSGGDKGSIYGVVTLLEKYFGVSCYAANTYTFKESETLVVPP